MNTSSSSATGSDMPTIITIDIMGDEGGSGLDELCSSKSPEPTGGKSSLLLFDDSQCDDRYSTLPSDPVSGSHHDRGAVADPIAITISCYPTEPASLFLAMDHTNFRHDEFLMPVCKMGSAGVETDHHQSISSDINDVEHPAGMILGEDTIWISDSVLEDDGQSIMHFAGEEMRIIRIILLIV